MKQNIKLSSNTYAVSLLSALVTFIVYLPSLNNDFVTWDDGQYVYNNEHIRFFNFHLITWSLRTFHAGNWHPLTWISHAFDYAVWGLNPVGHHLTNILLHALNTFLVTLLATRLIETYKSKKGPGDVGVSMSNTDTLLAGIVTGLLFGLHPIHVESVAWISERKDVLCASFFLLALLEYIRYVSEQETASSSRCVYSGVLSRYVLVFMLFFFAVLSKPMAVTFPAVLLVLDWFPFQRFQTAIERRQVIMEKIPFFFVSAVLSVVTLFAQKTGHAVVALEMIPFKARIMNAVKTLIGYLINMIWPVDLLPLYPHPYWEYPDLMSAQYMVPLLATVFISAGCIFIVKSQKIWLAVWTSYIVMLLPVLGIIQVGIQGMSNRYTYLPSIGLFLIVGIGAGLVSERIISSVARRMEMRLTLIILFIFIVVLANTAIRQIHIWKDGVTLWNYEIEELAKKPLQNWQAIVYHQRGTAHARLGRYDEAIKDYNISISLNPNEPGYYYNRGTAFAKQGSFTEAIDDLTKAISLGTEPNPDYYLNRGIALKKLGRLEEGERDITKAAKLINEILR